VPTISGWQDIAATPTLIDRWTDQWPDSINTGLLTRTTPAIDIDIMHPEAADAVEELARLHFEERGRLLVRYGKPPKRALLLRTDEPFKKITRSFNCPNSDPKCPPKIEVLAAGQQIVAFGTHTRGSSAKEAAADVALALLGEKAVSGEVANVRLAVRKNRAGPSGQEIPFAMRTVEISTEPKITSLVIDWRPTTANVNKAEDADRWAKSLRLLRRALMNTLVDHGKDRQPFHDGSVMRAVDLEIVRAEFYKSYPAADDDAKKRQETRRKASAGPCAMPKSGA
jgi:hypothetical protein